LTDGHTRPQEDKTRSPRKKTKTPFYFPLGQKGIEIYRKDRLKSQTECLQSFMGERKRKNKEAVEQGHRAWGAYLKTKRQEGSPLPDSGVSPENADRGE